MGGKRRSLQLRLQARPRHGRILFSESMSHEWWPPQWVVEAGEDLQWPHCRVAPTPRWAVQADL